MAEKNDELLTLNSKSLTDEEKEKLARQDTRLVSEFLSKKLETDIKKNWDLFYKRNETRFFKDRHWTTREFIELAGLINSENRSEEMILLELGCGVGNFIYPLIEEGLPNFRIYACDISPRAIDLLKAHPKFDESRITAFQANITEPNSLEIVEPVNLATLIFVLSAIHPDKFDLALKNIFHVLKPGGIVLFRDYGLYDMAQIRFKPGHKISDNFYMRQDGTRSYFFSTEELEKLFERNGFKVLNNSYVHRRTLNKKEEVDVPRVFIQAKFMKPTRDENIT